MARAQGARAQMALAFETVYGTAPAGGFTRMPFASTSLGSEQPLISSELLGYGRDPLAPIKDAVTADGDVVVPIDAAAFGFWLKAAFGEPPGLFDILHLRETADHGIHDALLLNAGWNCTCRSSLHPTRRAP